MNIKHIEYILEVSRCQSISQASKNLFINQSTLSNILCTFENSLGVKIFYRTNKGIRLTEAGEQILPELNKLLLHHNRIRDIASVQQNKKTNLHIIAYPVGELSAMINVLGSVKQQFPECQLHFYQIKPESIVKKMLYNGNTIGLGALSALRYNQIRIEAENEGFTCTPLFQDPFYLYVHKTHKLAQYKRVDFSTILNEPMVLMQSLILPGENVFYSDFQKLTNVSTFDNYESLKKTILKFPYATIAPGLAFYEDIYCQSGEIIQIPLAGIDEHLVNFLLTPKDPSQLSKLEQTIILEISHFFKSLPCQTL